MNLGYVDDSWLRCPTADCGKRMFLEIGPDESTGEVQAWHVCWSCNYTEREREWRVPRTRTVVSTAAERRLRMRLA